MYLNVADNGAGGAIVIGDKINDLEKVDPKIQLNLNVDLNGKITRAFFYREKPHPTEALNVHLTSLKIIQLLLERRLVNVWIN